MLLEHIVRLAEEEMNKGDNVDFAEFKTAADLKRALKRSSYPTTKLLFGGVTLKKVIGDMLRHSKAKAGKEGEITQTYFVYFPNKRAFEVVYDIDGIDLTATNAFSYRYDPETRELEFLGVRQLGDVVPSSQGERIRFIPSSDLQRIQKDGIVFTGNKTEVEFNV